MYICMYTRAKVDAIALVFVSNTVSGCIMYVCMYVYIYRCMYVYVYRHIHNAFTHLYIYIDVYWSHVCVYMYVY